MPAQRPYTSNAIMMPTDALGVNWRRMMDAAHLPIAVLDTDLTLLYRNPATAGDPVFSATEPGQKLVHTGLRSAGPLRERTDARHEFIKASARGGGPQCFSETIRIGGKDRMIFWVCVLTTSDAGDLLLVFGLGDAWKPSDGRAPVRTGSAYNDYRLPLSVISGEADSLADLLEGSLSDRASAIGRTARHMLSNLERGVDAEWEACRR